jgi:hypothetical protein
VKASGEPALKAEDRDAVVNIVAARTCNSKEEASHIVDNYARLISRPSKRSMS